MSPKRRAILVVALVATGLLWSMNSDRPSPRAGPKGTVGQHEAASSEVDVTLRLAGESDNERGASGGLNSDASKLVRSPPSNRPATSTLAKASAGSTESGSSAQTAADADLPDLAAGRQEFPPRAAFDGFVPSEVQPLDVERTEATVADIHACIEAGGCSPTDFGRGPGCTVGTEQLSHPANCVTHVGARAYCRWIGARLPTVREWLQEATDGGQRRWPWGEDSLSCARAVLRHSCGESGLLPVCSRPLGNSRTGACDLIGNVAEWTRTVRDGYGRAMGDQISTIGMPMWVRADDARPEVGVRCVRDNAARTGP